MLVLKSSWKEEREAGQALEARNGLQQGERREKGQLQTQTQEEWDSGLNERKPQGGSRVDAAAKKV